MVTTLKNKVPADDLARVFKILAEPNRLRIVVSMGLDCSPVSAIIAATGLTQTNVSFHLRVLREAGIVKAERRGGFIFYCLYDFQLLDLLSQFDDWRKTCDTAPGALKQKKAG
jgi:ArsR family transcriptional regulator